MSLSSPGVEQGGSKNLPVLKYNALKWESRFTLCLNTAKSTDNTDCIEKCFKIEVLKN